MAHATFTLPLPELTARAHALAGTVLFVSAPSDDREMYADYFRNQAFGAIEVQTAEDAYSCAVKTLPSAVILDVGLPGGEDGLELTRRLKRDPRLRNVPVIVVTGYVSANVRHAAESAGCDLFVVKPCLPDVLLRTIRFLIARSAADPARGRGSDVAPGIFKTTWQVA